MTTPTNEPVDPITTAPAVTPDQLPQVLGAMTEDYLQDEMRTLKRELSQESREVADDRLAKRMRSEKGPAATVMDTMEKVTSLLNFQCNHDAHLAGKHTRLPQPLHPHTCTPAYIYNQYENMTVTCTE